MTGRGVNLLVSSEIVVVVLPVPKNDFIRHLQGLLVFGLIRQISMYDKKERKRKINKTKQI